MRKSFTLIELLVVIAIIGILSSLVIARFSNWNENARIAKVFQWSSSVNKILGSDMIAYWGCNEGSGVSLRDSSGRGNNGTLGAGVVYNNSVIPAGQGSSLHFSGGVVSLPFSLGAATNPKNTDITVVAWVRPDIVPLNEWSISIVSGFSYHWFVSLPENKPTAFIYNSVATLFSAQDSTPIDILKWNHITAVYTASTIKIYVNGELKNESVWTGNFTAADTGMTIGGRASGRFMGFLDDVGIYGRELTSEEIGRIYVSQAPRYAYGE